MFEGFSEVLDKDNTWTAPSSSNASEAYDVINELNQLFVDTVRAAGYVNKNRILICNTYAAVYTENVIKHMEIPEDSVKNKLIAEVHDYEPYDFTAPDSL